MIKKICFLFLMLVNVVCYGKDAVANIDNFIIKESLLKNNKLAIIAADSLENPLETVNGIYTFSVSGFTQQLSFNDGIAILQLPIEKSTFIYIKHENETGTHSKLAYIYKKGNELNPITISRIYFILVPLIIIFLAFAFKRFIYIGVILFLIFFFFNYNNGLDVSTYFETIFDYLKNLI